MKNLKPKVGAGIITSAAFVVAVLIGNDASGGEAPSPGIIEPTMVVGAGDHVHDNNNPPCRVRNEDQVLDIAFKAARENGEDAVARDYPYLAPLVPLVADRAQILVDNVNRWIARQPGWLAQLMVWDRYATCGTLIVKLSRPITPDTQPLFAYSENIDNPSASQYNACVHRDTDDSLFYPGQPGMHYVSCHYSAWIWSVSPDGMTFVGTYKNWSDYNDTAKVSLP